MTTRDQVRALALALPEAEEAPHHGIPSFRVRGKIFCTIHLDHPRVMVKLDPEDQHIWSEARPDAVAPVPGGWGRGGSTFVSLEGADETLLRTLLDIAWRRIAPNALIAARDSEAGGKP
jgi:hypothetical protein